MINKGYIPENIVYVYYIEKIRATRHDNKETFVVDKESKNSILTARKWASGVQGCNRITGEVVLENKPFDGLKILHFEIRYNGGRAWKVKDKNNHCFDLREDVLLEVIKNEGISPGGVLNSKFIWSHNGAGTKLIRANSESHEKLKELTVKRKLPKLKRKDIFPGGVYSNRFGRHFICLGSENGKQPYLYIVVPKTWEILQKEDIETYLKSADKMLFKIINNSTFIEESFTVTVDDALIAFLKSKHITNQWHLTPAVIKLRDWFIK